MRDRLNYGVYFGTLYTYFYLQKLKYFFKNISNNQITLLSDINKEFFINKSNKTNYYEIDDFEIQYFYNFISNLNNNSIYSISPLISIKGNSEDPYLVLSKAILVTKYSDLIRFHLYSKYLKALDDFGIDYLENYKLIFKYKKVRFDVDQINRKFRDI